MNSTACFCSYAILYGCLWLQLTKTDTMVLLQKIVLMNEKKINMALALIAVSYQNLKLASKSLLSPTGLSSVFMRCLVHVDAVTPL